MLDFSVTFIITIVNITLLFFILKAILWKPVGKFMADRAAKVQASIDQAEQDKAQSRHLLEQYQDRLKNAETEAETIIKTARETAEAEAARIVAGAKADAAAVLANGRRQLEAEQQAVFARFKLEAAALVMAAAARLVQRDFTAEDNRRYAALLLDEIAAQQSSLGKGNR